MKNLTTKSYWIILAITFITFIFVGGTYNIGLLAFITPVFILLLSRNTQKVWQYIVFAVAIIVATILKYPEMFGLGSPDDQFIAVLCALMLLVSFTLDRFIFNNFIKNGSTTRKFVGTLIFPTIIAFLELVSSLASFGAFVGISTTQLNFLPLLQSASIVGQYGLSFIICWVPSFIYFLIQIYSESETKKASELFAKIKTPLIIFLIANLTIFGFGDLRIFLTEPSKDQVKIAYAHAYEQRTTDTNEYVVEEPQVLKDAFANELRAAADGGARLLVFNEEAFYMYKDQKDEFLKFAQEQTKAHGIYVGLGIEIEDRSGKELSDNGFILISPQGEILYHYSKSVLIPFLESNYYAPGDHKIPIVPLELIPGIVSNVSATICYEGESTTYFSQIGTRSDIHLNPSFEWKETEQLHTASNQLRAIEYGVSVIEPTTVNTSAVFDPLGQIVASSSTSKTDYSEVTFGNVPAKGLTTIYAICGQWLNYLYIPGLMAFAILAILNAKKRKA